MIQKAEVKDIPVIAELACQLWPDNTVGEMQAEFASDCGLENTQSLQFHLNVGFEEANRIICFTKKL